MAEKKFEAKPEPKLRDAAARTAEVLQTLQTRLRREALAPTAEERAEDLDRQLQAYFAASSSAASSATATTALPQDLRERVIGGVVEKVLRTWNDPTGGLADVKNEVVARLVERVLAELKDKQR